MYTPNISAEVKYDKCIHTSAPSVANQAAMPIVLHLSLHIRLQLPVTFLSRLRVVFVLPDIKYTELVLQY